LKNISGKYQELSLSSSQSNQRTPASSSVTSDSVNIGPPHTSARETHLRCCSRSGDQGVSNSGYIEYAEGYIDDDGCYSNNNDALAENICYLSRSLFGVIQEFNGHRNCDTVKQVNYYGLRSEFVVSGSDCGNIFIWSAKSGKVVRLMKGDSIGAINCLTPHPTLPILITCGLEHTAKVWEVDGHYLTNELNIIFTHIVQSNTINYL
jgi:WD40 repeat protein